MTIIPPLTSNGFGTSAAFLRKQFSETVSTVRLLLFRSELLSGENLLTVLTTEAVTVERGALVRDTSLVDHLQGRNPHVNKHVNKDVKTIISWLNKTNPIAFSTSLRVLILIALYANHSIITWDETLVSDWLVAYL